MLVLSRNVGEVIVLTSDSGEEIVVTLVRSGHKTQIGIDAPQNWNIARGELHNDHHRRNAAVPVLLRADGSV